MKKFFNILGLGILAFGIGFTLSGCQNEQVKNPEQALSEDPKITETDTLIHDDPKYVVYFTQPGCHYCAEVDPDVIKFANKVNDIKVYHYNINPETWQSTPFAKSTNGKDSPLEANIDVTDDVNVSSTPTLFYINDGKIVTKAMGTQTDSGYTESGEMTVPALLDKLTSENN